ncbi:MAG: mechanosensitive ion channel family protein [Spirulinaceae cyanobacterium]
MDLSQLKGNISQFNAIISDYNIPDYAVFLGFLLLALLVGRFTPTLVRIIVYRWFPQQGKDIYSSIISPIAPSVKIAGTLILVYLSFSWLKTYEGLYNFLKFFLDLAVTISLAWVISRLLKQIVRIYGINLVRKLGREVDELLLIFETLANITIGFVAAISFARSQNIDLVGLLAGLGIGGLAIAFAAQNTLQQLLGTIVLYLDRPFITGEYIRLPNGTFGRVESIGLRSTKIRTAAKSTLMIVPNSNMANFEIENVTRGKKVMVLLYLDFAKILEKSESALVEQVVKESTDSLFGIDPGSTKITLFEPEDKPGSRGRVTFFILGSSENSLELRKRLLELANESITKKLTTHKIDFVLQEPTIYVESPMTI